jgi:hypothetical protein
VEVANYRLNYSDISRPLPFLANRCLWCRLTRSASGDGGRNKGPASLRPRRTRGGSSVAAIPVYLLLPRCGVLILYTRTRLLYYECLYFQFRRGNETVAGVWRKAWNTASKTKDIWTCVKPHFRRVQTNYTGSSTRSTSGNNECRF